MIDAKTLAEFCQSVYEGDQSQFTSILDNGSVCVGVANIGGQAILVFRGSLTDEDWTHDFEAIPIAVPRFGTLHDGFWQGIEDIFEKLPLLVGESVVITGHSLGCAHAAYVARMCLLRGIAVSQLYLFAPPLMGYQDFHDGLDYVDDVKAWRNGIDPVPLVPIPLPDMPWVQFPLIKVEQHPEGIGEFDPFKYHRIALYIEALSDVTCIA